LIHRAIGPCMNSGVKPCRRNMRRAFLSAAQGEYEAKTDMSPALAAMSAQFSAVKR
jgi:hypothetical protein